MNALTSFPLSQTLPGGFSGLAFPLSSTVALDRLGLPAAPLADQVRSSVNQTQLLSSMLSMLVQLMKSGGSANPDAGFAGVAGLGAAAAPMSSGGGNAASAASATADVAAGAGGPKVQKFIDAALGKQGTRYVFGAEGPDTFDCSGLVAYALKQAGSKTGRMTAEGYRSHYQGASVPKDQLKPGDLVFFSHTGAAPATHIEIYLGNNETMGAHTESMPNGKAKLNTKTLLSAARPPELQS